MSNSSIRHAAQEHAPAQDSLFSSDATRRAIEQAFITRLFARLCVTPKGLAAGRLRKMVDVLDSGQVDQVIEQLAPDTAPAVPLRFDDVPQFDHDAWRNRRG